MRGVLLDLDTLGDDLDLGRLEASLDDWRLHPVTAPGEVAGRIAGAEVVVTNKVVLDAATLAAASDLRFVAVAATGTNNVDLDAARDAGVVVSNVTAYGTPSVAQHVFTLLLALTTKVFEYREAVAEGRWAASPHFCLLDYPIRELAGKTLGIVGYGELGQGVARLAEAFDMEVRIAQRPGGSPREGRVPLTELLPEVDVLTLHCPLTDATRNLIGADELAAMRDDAVLINTARGGIVDEAALAAALRTGRLGGAGFDVLTVEPPHDGNPLLEPDIPNLIVTPHVAWAARESRQRLIDQVAENIERFRAGDPRNRVA
ncbi:MAG: 2-hydroxyacid dehydrogenase [Gammaproteobacteria bacterium]|nr:2-hydroxyacid dehydrogenase [Gammaproteobacteria bacterium]